MPTSSEDSPDSTGDAPDEVLALQQAMWRMLGDLRHVQQELAALRTEIGVAQQTLRAYDTARTVPRDYLILVPDPRPFSPRNDGASRWEPQPMRGVA